jgi:hypothetical protein
MGSDKVSCPFWHDWRRHFGVRYCDNLVDGVPVCVREGYYRVFDPSIGDSVEHWDLVEHRRVYVWGEPAGICLHFCRSDVR